MIKRFRVFFLVFFLSFSFGALAEDSVWYSTAADGSVQIHLYFFWSKTCGHCHRALPLLPKLEKSYPWLKIHSLEISDDRNVTLYLSMADKLGQRPNSVPGFLFCEQMSVGYGMEETTGLEIKQQLERCYQKQTKQASH
ncbi:MAG: thioredoxin family protein [Thiomargarita sp.]|nr:thioredoxin family protein [Thiomargarita sp.]